MGIASSHAKTTRVLRSQVNVTLERDGDRQKVYAPYYAKPKDEGWWLILGDPATNQLLSIKRLTVGASAKAKLDFEAPEAAGAKTYKLYYMSDSYLGCDQEYELEMKILEDDSDEEEDDEEEDEEGAGEKRKAAGSDESEGEEEGAKKQKT